MLRIVSSPAYPLIKNQRTLPDQHFVPSQTQYQSMLYAELGPLHKLEMRYVSVLKHKLSQLEMRVPFPVAPWWELLNITIALNNKETIATHNAILKAGTHMVIYTDGSGIDNKVGASAITLFTPIERQPPIVADREQAYLGPLTKYTVYSGELIGLDLALKIARKHSDTLIAIFTDDQSAILAISCSRN